MHPPPPPPPIPRLINVASIATKGETTNDSFKSRCSYRYWRFAWQPLAWPQLDRQPHSRRKLRSSNVGVHVGVLLVDVVDLAVLADVNEHAAPNNRTIRIDTRSDCPPRSSCKGCVTCDV